MNTLDLYFIECYFQRLPTVYHSGKCVQSLCLSTAFLILDNRLNFDEFIFMLE